MGHFCRICGRTRPNERFSGGGHRTHVCRQCQKLPVAKRRAVEALAEIDGFLNRQTHISKKNVERLGQLALSSDLTVAAQAAILLDVARVAPFKRRRSGRIRAAHPDLWRRMLDAGLAWPEHPDDWTDPLPGDDPFRDDDDRF